MNGIKTIPDLERVYRAAKRAMIVRCRDAGMTQRETAEALGVTRGALGNYCHNHNIKWSRRATKVAFCGSENPNAKLTEADVRAIKRAGDEKCDALGAFFGVSGKTVSAIRNGRIWGHVQ